MQQNKQIIKVKYVIMFVLVRRAVHPYLRETIPLPGLCTCAPLSNLVHLLQIFALNGR